MHPIENNDRPSRPWRRLSSTLLAKLVNAETLLEWAKSVTWKGIKPVVNLCRKVYEKGVFLSKQAMREVEARLVRNPNLPKRDILIRPS